jgi:DNA-directed RNA polymerase subunit RPC12/RpoP
MTEEVMVVGSLHRTDAKGEYERNCSKCGVPVYLSDEWNKEDKLYICPNCFIKMKHSGKSLKLKIDDRTVKRVNKATRKRRTKEELIEVFKKEVGKEKLHGIGM